MAVMAPKECPAAIIFEVSILQLLSNEIFFKSSLVLLQISSTNAVNSFTLISSCFDL